MKNEMESKENLVKRDRPPKEHYGNPPPPIQPPPIRPPGYPQGSRTNIPAVTIFLTILVIILLIGIIVTVGIIFSGPSYSSELRKVNENLDETRDELRITEDELNKTKNELIESEETLKNTQDELNQTNTELDDTNKELKKTNKELNETEKELNELKAINHPPEASIIADSTSGYQTRKIRFDASGSNDIDGEIIEYKWDFGNDDFGSGSIVEYDYDNIGKYTVTLTVTDDKNTKDTDSIEITIYNAINISISEIDQNDRYDDLIITLIFTNSGDHTASTDEPYWMLKTTDGSSQVPDMCYYLDTVPGRTYTDFELSFDDVDGIPDKLIFHDPNFHQEVELNVR